MGNIVYYEDIQLVDGVKGFFGTGEDLRIQHDAGDSLIDNYTGHLYLTNYADNKDIYFRSDDGSGGVTTYFYVGGTAEQTIFVKNTEHQDGTKAQFGNAGDMQMYHDGTNSYIINGTGAFYIMQGQNDGNMVFQCDDGSGGNATYFSLDGGSSATNELYTKWPDYSRIALGTGKDLQIYHNSTNSLIENSTGDLYISNKHDDGNIQFYCDDGSGGTAQYFRLDGGLVETSFLKTTHHYDNVKANFGDGNDLEIYHNGSNSFISDTGTGLLVISSNHLQVYNAGISEFMITAEQNGAVNLYYDGSKKFETTTTGIDVTGEVKGDSLDIDGNADISGDVNMTDGEMLMWGGNSILTHSGSATTIGDNSSGSVISIASGDSTFAGNILMTGTGHFGAADNLYIGGATAATDHTYIGDSSRNVTIYNGANFTVAGGLTTLEGNVVVSGTDVTITGSIIHSGDTNTYFGFHGNDLWRVVTGGSERLEVSNSGVKLGNTGATVTQILDEDNMASDSATALATQQSIKAYVDNSTTGVLTYQGTWNASTNSPSLSSGSGTPGYYYIVSVAGSTNLDGITDWAAGDWAVFSDQSTDAWQKIDNTAVGDVSVGTGAASSRVSYWSGTTTIAGTAGFTFDGSNLSVPGNITQGGSTFTATGDLTIDCAGDITLDADGGDINLKDAGTTFGTLSNSSSDFWIGAGVQDKDIIFRGNDNGSYISALRLDMSDAGWAHFNAGITVGTGTSTFAGNIAMGGYDITGLDEIYFSTNTKLGPDGTGYLKLTYIASGGGGLKVVDGDGLVQGYLYGDGNATSSFGLLDGSANWAVRCVESEYVELRYNNSKKFETTSTGVKITAANTSDLALNINDRIKALGNGSMSWGSSADFGNLTWDTGYALVGGLSGKGLKLFTNGGSGIALTLDTSQNATFAGRVDVAGGDVNIQAGALSITADGSNKATLTETGAGLLTIAAEDDIVLDAGSDVILDAAGDDIRLRVSGTEFGKFNNASSNLNIYSSIQDKDIVFWGDDAGSSFTALTLDMSSAGTATFNNELYIPNRIGHVGDADTYIGFSAANHFNITCGSIDFLAIDGSGMALSPSTNVSLISSNLVLSGDSNIVLDTSVSSTESSGTIIKIGSHMSSLVAGNIYYAYNSMGSLYWGGADADSSNTENMLALSVGTDADVDGMLLNGIYHKASHGLTVGEPIYLSTSPMAMTNTAPSGSGDYVRVLGYALDSNHIYFCPDNTWVKID